MLGRRRHPCGKRRSRSGRHEIGGELESGAAHGHDAEHAKIGVGVKDRGHDPKLLARTDQDNRVEDITEIAVQLSGLQGRIPLLGVGETPLKKGLTSMPARPHQKRPYMRFIRPPGDDIRSALRHRVRLGDGLSPAGTQPMGQRKKRRPISQ